MTEFKPYLMEIPEGYRFDELSNAYADAAEQGLWIKEWGTSNDTALCAVGSYYELQLLEHKNPGVELDPQEFGLGDCVELGAPGSGSTRVESVLNGIETFKTLQPERYARHVAWHEEASHD